MDEDFRRYLYTLLANALGYNLRNLYMHGLTDQGTSEHAAALIHTAVFLAGLRPASNNPKLARQHDSPALPSGRLGARDPATGHRAHERSGTETAPAKG